MHSDIQYDKLNVSEENGDIMPFTLNNIFNTITANPNRIGNYIEIEPCSALKPYIRCFWGSKYNRTNNEGKKINKTRVIPDVCMDIILTANTATNQLNGHFCGINNSSFISTESDNFCFGIRFYAWSVILFSDGSMRGALNTFTDIEAYFSDFTEGLKEKIFLASNFYERTVIAEKYLLNKLNTNRENSDIMNSLFFIIKRNGNLKAKDLSDFSFISKRQLERKFLENTGVSPKQMINLIRYQMLWQDCIKYNFNVLNSVEKFGYCDQAHLLNDFKKYHGISLNQARDSVIK